MDRTFATCTLCGPGHGGQNGILSESAETECRSDEEQRQILFWPEPAKDKTESADMARAAEGTVFSGDAGAGEHSS